MVAPEGVAICIPLILPIPPILDILHFARFTSLHLKGPVYLPAVAFLILAALFIAFVLSSASSLPPTLATHFSGGGYPNAWMAASDYVTFIISFGLGLPLLIVGVFYVHRWLPRSLINLPRKNFWLAPERLPDTHRYLARRGLWLGCIVLLLMLGLHFTVVRANQLTPPHLAPKSALLLLTIFVGAFAIWTIIFVRHFLCAGSGRE